MISPHHRNSDRNKIIIYSGIWDIVNQIFFCGLLELFMTKKICFTCLHNKILYTSNNFQKTISSVLIVSFLTLLACETIFQLPAFLSTMTIQKLNCNGNCHHSPWIFFFYCSLCFFILSNSLHLSVFYCLTWGEMIFFLKVVINVFNKNRYYKLKCRYVVHINISWRCKQHLLVTF